MTQQRPGNMQVLTEAQQKSMALRQASRDKIDGILKGLAPVEQVVYNYMLHNAFVDDDVKMLLRNRQADLEKEKTLETSAADLSLRSWVKGVFDGFRGMPKISEDRNINEFIKGVFNAIDLQSLINAHLDVLTVYVKTEDALKEAANAEQKPA